jgi:hypothetical protein
LVYLRTGVLPGLFLLCIPATKQSSYLCFGALIEFLEHLPLLLILRIVSIILYGGRLGHCGIFEKETWSIRARGRIVSMEEGFATEMR